jgi:16S rRNA A1518/A1519 N6-dimethyltransferase RsmA/KsgA/DIM1 with predicted DNA glycosylase/AP lyase activity
LAARVRLAVQDNVIFIEEFATQSTYVIDRIPYTISNNLILVVVDVDRRCALLDTQRPCRYRIKLGDDDQWHTISSLCRNRVSVVNLSMIIGKMI